MSSSLIYHAFGARQYRYESTEYRGGAVYFHIAKKRHQQRCSACGSRDVVLAGRTVRRLRTLPIGRRRVFLVVHLHDLACRGCGVQRLERLEIADPRVSYTRALARYVIELKECMTLLDISRHLGLGWDTVKAIVMAHLQRKLKRRSFRHVERIGIDEVSYRKGHRYLTNVVDLDSGEVIWCAEGRGTEVLRPFFMRLRGARSRLKAVAVDFHGPYLEAIRRWAPPDVVVVHDRYHVMALMSRVVDAVRRDAYRRLRSSNRKVIKGARYLLLKASERLSERGKRRLDALLAMNEPLHRVYLLKEDLRQLWNLYSYSEAAAFLDNWIQEALSLGHPAMDRFVATLIEHREELLNWYRYPIGTSLLEGINNKIKVLQRRAYGYRDLEFLKLRILFIRDARTLQLG